jgi:uncharacterized membrane protein
MYPILPCDGRRSITVFGRGLVQFTPRSHAGAPITLRTALIALAVAFPLTAHLSVAWASAPLAVACIAILGLLVLLPGLARGRRPARAGTVVLALLLPWLWHRELVWLPLYAPSVLGDFAACWLFGHTLRPGHTPLITRVVQLLHAPEALPEAVAAYTRRLTALWGLLFLVLGAVSLALALCAVPHGILALLGLRPVPAVPQRAWSLFANCLEYLLVAAFMAGEYLWRVQHFPQQPHQGFLDFLRRVIAAAPAAGLASLGRGAGR